MTSELKLAIAITKQTNDLLRKRFNRHGARNIHFKKHAEIVTATDLLANRQITKALLQAFPNYDVISEEAKKIDNPGTKTWYIDPLDGTSNFAYGFSEFATCLALQNKKTTLLGVIGLPLFQEIYYAEKNKGAWCNRGRLYVSSNNKHDKPMLLLCAGHSPVGRERFHNFFSKLDLTQLRFRMFFSAGVEMISVASGRADVCVLSEIKPWDVLAGVILVREAGGQVINWHGQDWKLDDKTLIAGNKKTIEQMLELTKNIK